MSRLVLILSCVVAVRAIRFHELTDGETHFHGVPVEKYVSSMNRIMEIEDLLNGETQTQRRFEDIDWSTNSNDPKMNPFLFQGDIALNERQLDVLVERYEVKLDKKEGRQFSELFSIGDPIGLWHTFPIPWTINAQNPSSGGYEVIRRGIQLWEHQTCVTFAENATTPATNNSIEFRNGKGCSSDSIGLPEAYDETVANVTIGNGCQSPATVAHEIGHVLGLFHIQSRFDADQYLDIFWSNIDPNDTFQFEHPDQQYNATYRGIPYDYGSAMQYDRFSFSVDSRPTMLPKDRNYNNTMGQDFELAFTDAKEINMIYCNHVCPKKLPCQNGGYTDPKDCSKCRCPDGLAGTLCDRIRDSDPDCDPPILNATLNFQRLLNYGNMTCYNKIQAPPGRKLKIILKAMRFQGEDPSYESCADQFVEVKYAEQYQTAGARFCSQKLPGTRTMTSLRNEALVTYKSTEVYHFASIHYKYE